MQYLCIDLKSFYASVECVARNLNPLKANLLVADESRTDKTICLAVSPALKAKGVGSRPRLFEARQAIRLYEAAHKTKVSYIVAPPRMAEYLRVSAQVYGIYRQFLSEEDIHVYSIDECFIDLTPYLHLYRAEAERAGVSPARFLAMRMIRAVLVDSTGIEDVVGSDQGNFAYVSDGNIIVNGGPSTGSGTLQVIDVMGHIVVSTDVARNVSTSGMIPGVYVLRLINGNNVKTQKIIIQ